MKTKFKVGQRVYCKKHKQYGRIYNIRNTVYGVYPIEVYLDYEGRRTYSLDGKWHLSEDISLIIPIEEKINKLLKV